VLLHKSNHQPEEKHFNNKGFSLIELLISLAILAIVIAPLLNNFVTAAKVSAKARKIQNETVLAQNILEEIKAQSIDETKKTYNDPVPFVITSNKYFLAKKNIVYCNKTYDALITMDSTKYIGTDPSGVKIGYNTIELPFISQINTSKNVLAVQSYERILAVENLYGKHLAYCAEQEAFSGVSITRSTEADILASLKKEIKINITKKVNETEVKVTFEYSSSIAGCDTEPPEPPYTVVNKKIIAPMGSVYIFYYPDYSDSISISKDPSVSDVIDVYLVKQAIGSSNSEKIDGSIPVGINLYSNTKFKDFFDGSIESKDLVKKEDAKNRIFDIKVQLYNAEKNFSADQLCVEFISTKEE